MVYGPLGVKTHVFVNSFPSGLTFRRERVGFSRSTFHLVEKAMLLLATPASDIQGLVTKIYQFAYPFLTAVSAIGVISMAIIQTIKDTLPVRQWFQKYRADQWLGEKCAASQTDHRLAEKDLVHLATDGDSDALYSLPIEQLSGQLNTAIQAALDKPKGHEHLVRCLASKADPEDLNQVLSPPADAMQPRSTLTPDQQKRFDAYVDARNRVTHQVQRALDGFQIAVGFRWKLYLQLASIGLSAALAFIAVQHYASNDLSSWKKFCASLAVGILAGFLAPVARDLVAALQQLRS